jgi:HUS1 checkpoint protein
LNQSDNRIAFAADVSLLHLALHSALTIHMQSQTDLNAVIQIKLVKKLPVGAQATSPYLTFETKGLHAAVVQDVPISKPLSHADLLQLESVLDSVQEFPQVNY